MKRVANVALQQGGQPFAVGDREGARGQFFQDLLGVVGAAKKSAVQALADAAMNLGARRDQQHAESRAHGNGSPGANREARGKSIGQQNGRNHSDHEQQRHESAFDHQVTRAALEQYRNVEHAVLDDSVGERERKQEQRQGVGHVQPKWRLPAGEVLCASDDNRRPDARHCSPEQDAYLAPDFRAGF